MKTSKTNRRIDRRGFIRRLGSGVAGGLVGSRMINIDNTASYASDRSEMKITCVSKFSLHSERWKVVGKNSRGGVHGKYAKDEVIKIETNSGVEGVGFSRAEKEQARSLLGKDPLSFYQPGIGIYSPLGVGDAPLWDLIGKIYQQPVWRLIGGFGPEWVPVYDGSIYFSDLEPQYGSKGIDRILYEVEYSLKKGHRAFKIKVGRGAKWMEPKAGFQRDVEVVRAIRNLVGPEIKLMVDANNGYDLVTTKRFVEAADDNFFFIEEMFQENVEKYQQLMQWLKENNRNILVADGENAKEVDDFNAYIKQKLIDVFQGDMRRFGFTNFQKISQNTINFGIRLAPHNWGSLLGFYMQLTLGRGIPNFLMAEQDPLVTDMVDVSAFEFKEGKIKVPNIPGCGIVFKKDFFSKSDSLIWKSA